MNYHSALFLYLNYIKGIIKRNIRWCKCGFNMFIVFIAGVLRNEADSILFPVSILIAVIGTVLVITTIFNLPCIL